MSQSDEAPKKPAILPVRCFLEVQVGNTRSMDVILHAPRDQVPDHEVLRQVLQNIATRHFYDEIYEPYDREDGVPSELGPGGIPIGEEPRKRKRRKKTPPVPPPEPVPSATEKEYYYAHDSNLQLAYLVEDVKHERASFSLSKDGKLQELVKLSKRIVAFVVQPGDTPDMASHRPELIPLSDLFRQPPDSPTKE